jgi:hypothetical protein
MEKLTFDEIVAVLEELKVTPQLLDQDFDDWADEDIPEDLKAQVIERVGEIKEIYDASEGGEDSGSHYRRVYHFVDHDVYVGVAGYYQSYDGTEYNEKFYDLTPSEKTIVVFKGFE